MFLRLGDGVDPSVVGMGLGLDVVSQQTEQREKDVLEITLVFVMDLVRDPGRSCQDG